MKRLLSYPYQLRLASAVLLGIVLLLTCGLSALAVESPEPEIQQATPPQIGIAPLPTTAPEVIKEELYPAGIQTISDANGRQIVRTYILTAAQRPSDIPRDSFVRDGWRYTLTDIIEQRTAGIDTRSYIETLEFNTDSNDLNEIIKLLAPTLEYRSEDGYVGVLTLDLVSVNCEEAGRRNSSFIATSTREYPHLSNPDTSLIPKTITDNGRTLALDSVSWEAQNYTNVDYMDIPDSYRAVAMYSANASRSVVTGYITTADYYGEISKMVTGDTIYTAYFVGIEIDPAPAPVPVPEPAEPDPEPVVNTGNGVPIIPIIIGIAILAALAGAGAYLYLHRNVKIYRDDFKVMVAKDKISRRNMVIDLSPLEGKRFGIRIDAMTAKSLNGQSIEIRYHVVRLNHKIAYEGNAYRIEVDFGDGTIQALY